MNGVLLAIAYLAVVNPPRTRTGVPEDGTGRARSGVLGLGSVGALLALGALGGWSGPILDALQITPETFRLAAGLIVGIAGLRTLVVERPADEPELDGWGAAAWPVAFPRLFTPETAALALTTGSQEGGMAVLGGAAAALALLNALGWLRRTERTDRFLVRLGRMMSVLLMVMAVFLVVDGIRDV